jgi:acid phosphatase family membrane protein YuiD
MINELVEELRALGRENLAPQPLWVLLDHTYLEVVIGMLAGLAAFRWFP